MMILTTIFVLREGYFNLTTIHFRINPQTIESDLSQEKTIFDRLTQQWQSKQSLSKLLTKNHRIMHCNFLFVN